MPTLPTFTVTDAQAQRLIRAFGSQEAYKAWLKEQIILFVANAEGRILEQNAQIAKQGLADQIRKDFDAPVTP